MKALVGWTRAERNKRDPRPWVSRLFDKQLAFFLDKAKRKCAICTRRAGKSESAASALVDAIRRHPEAIVPYITKTAKNSKNILWNILLRMNRQYKLGLRPDSQSGMLWTKEGGCIWLAGCKDKSEAAEKFRGPKYPLCIIDEAGTFRSDVLEYLIEDVIEPALSDYDGTLWLIGTPGLLESGYFWARTTGKHEKLAAWPTHRWSVADNPHHPLSQPGALEAKRLSLGYELTHPTWQREWCGNWATDWSRLIYHYEPAKNRWDGEIPKGRQFRVLSVDLGYDDATSFTIGTSVEGFSEVFLEESYGMSGLLTSDIAQEVYRIKQRYKHFDVMVIDNGGLGTTIMMELIDIYQLPFQGAKKVDKAGSIRQAQDRLRMGKLKIHPTKCAELRGEWETLPWNDDRDDHAAGYEDHRSDGTLYNLREHPMLDIWQKESPELGSSEWARAQAEAAKRRLVRQQQRRSSAKRN